MLELCVGPGIPAPCRFGVSTAVAASEVGRLGSLLPDVPFFVSHPDRKLRVHRGILSVCVVRDLRRREIPCAVFVRRLVVVCAMDRARGRSLKGLGGRDTYACLKRKRGVETWRWMALHITAVQAHK